MQTKNNTIKTIILLLIGLFLGEGVLGLGLFWPYLFLLNLGVYSYWLVFLIGLFLSIYYGQNLGLMSAYMLSCLFLWQSLVGLDKFGSVLLIFFSLAANIFFDLFFGFGFSFWENLLLVLLSLVLARSMEKSSVIKINL